jgi:hypothetical protein
VDASGDTDGNAPAEGEPCEPDGALPCEAGFECEPTDSGHLCAAPIEIRGIVLDAQSLEPIEGAHVTALDEAGTPAGSVSISDAEGHYAISVRAARDADGTVSGEDTWTLFATAADYQPFPAGLRPAIPVSASDAVEATEDQPWIVENASTDLALLALPDDAQGGRTISGHVLGSAPGGTMVVAEGGPTPAPYTIADSDGRYTLFNVPDGSLTVVGYRAELDVEPASIDGEGDLDAVDLAEGTAATATVRGSVNIVNAPGGSMTSVVLVPSSLFIEGLERGPVPLGLRAPEAPEQPSIQGAFELAGVPPGSYAVLAAFENDALVRDPDTSIAGTDIVTIDVGTSDIDLAESFKVTEGLAVVSPGAEAPEVVMGTPTFVFADDSSEDRYEVVVFDAFGEVVWETLDVPGVSGADNVEVQYAGPTLDAGAYYQFRATSMRDNPNGSTAISRTEDLRGVFIAP